MYKKSIIHKANKIEWNNRPFIMMASPVTNFYVASRGIQAFEKGLRCGIFPTLFCLVNGTGRASVTAMLSAETTQVSLTVYPFAAYAFWLSFDPEYIRKTRYRGALSFIRLSSYDIANILTKNKVQNPDALLKTQPKVLIDALMTGYKNDTKNKKEQIRQKGQQIFQAIEKAHTTNKAKWSILKHIAPAGTLTKEQLIAARICCWIQEYTLTTNLVEELSELKYSDEESTIKKIEILAEFLEKLTSTLEKVRDKNNQKKKIKPKLKPPLKTIKNIAEVIDSEISHADAKIDPVYDDVIYTLKSFTHYINTIQKKIISVTQDKIDDFKYKKDKKTLQKIQKTQIERLYNDVLLQQLADHQALIRNKKTALSLALSFIFILGNITVYSTFAVIGGKDLIGKTTSWLASHLSVLLAPDVLTFLHSPPLLFSYIFAGLLFGIPTLLVSWYFGGGAVKKFLTQLALGDNRNPLKKAPNKCLWFIGLLISAFGSNMLFYHYISTTFRAMPLYFQFWLEFSIFVSTASLFIVLYNSSVKKYKKELIAFRKEQLNRSEENSNNSKPHYVIKLFGHVTLFFIFSTLCFVPVYADTISAKKLLSAKHTKFLNICYLHIHSAILLYSFIGSVAAFSIVFNIVYATKATVKIYIKLINGLKYFFTKIDKKKVNLFLLASMVITAIVLMSTQPHLSTFNLGLAIMTCFLCYAFYKTSIKILMIKKGIPKSYYLFLSLLAIFLVPESIILRISFCKNISSVMYTSLVIATLTVIAAYVCWHISSSLFSQNQSVNHHNQAIKNNAPGFFIKSLKYILFLTFTVSIMSTCFKNPFSSCYAEYTTIGLFSFCILGIIIKNLLITNVKQTLVDENIIKEIQLAK